MKFAGNILCNDSKRLFYSLQLLTFLSSFVFNISYFTGNCEQTLIHYPLSYTFPFVSLINFVILISSAILFKEQITMNNIFRTNLDIIRNFGAVSQSRGRSMTDLSMVFLVSVIIFTGFSQVLLKVGANKANMKKCNMSLRKSIYTHRL